MKTVNKGMRWFWERRSGGGSRVLTVLLLLVLKTVDKETKLFFPLSKGGGAIYVPV